MWFHCLNMITSSIVGKKISINANHRSGNIIGLVVQILFSAWTQLKIRVYNEALTANILAYMW